MKESPKLHNVGCKPGELPERGAGQTLWQGVPVHGQIKAIVTVHHEEYDTSPAMSDINPGIPVQDFF